MKKELDQRLGDLSDPEPPIRAEIMSFGFKRGLPRQADLVADVRFLPNPFYIDSLCRHSGLDEDVRRFVMEHPTTQEFMRRYTEMLDFLIPHYREEGKRRLVIAIGCTGGAHRSVAIAEALGAWMRDKGLPTEINHRDLLLEQARWTTPQKLFRGSQGRAEQAPPWEGLLHAERDLRYDPDFRASGVPGRRLDFCQLPAG